MSKNIWEEEFKKTKFAKEGGSYSKCCNYEEMYNELKAFFHQKFKEAFDEVERRSFKDKEHSNFRIIGDETFKEIKEKYN